MNTPTKITVVFTPYFDTNATRDAVGVLAMTEAIGDAYKVACADHKGAGPTNVRLDYINTRDSVINPLGTFGRFRVTVGCPNGVVTETALGFETKETSEWHARRKIANEIANSAAKMQ